MCDFFEDIVFTVRSYGKTQLSHHISQDLNASWKFEISTRREKKKSIKKKEMPSVQQWWAGKLLIDVRGQRSDWLESIK